MATRFRYIVIGRGMMGAAAARHLSDGTDGIALIGPGEPADRKRHDGVFASHYDEARITRTIDADPVWARLANRSIGRYAEIERQSGISFYTEAGCLLVGPQHKAGEGYLDRAIGVGRAMGIEVDEFVASGLASRFPQFDLAAGVIGYHEAKGAGHINPRALVKAQVRLAVDAGLTLVDATVTSVRDDGGHVEVIAAGETYTAERVLVAAGGFSNFHDLLPKPVDLRVVPRTVAFYELGPREMEIFGSMPSTIVFGDRDEDHVYILPPVRYSDGKTYLKLGGDLEPGRFESLPDIVKWFHTDGNLVERDHLHSIATKLMPALAGCPLTSAACVATFTPTGRPYAGLTQSKNIAVLTGGNFVAAKSSDELGRLGAVLLRDGGLGSDNFGAEIAPVFAEG